MADSRSAAPRTVREPAREVPVLAEVDVLVVGGGPAGVAAATQAARLGASCFLVERHGFLGGMWTAGMVLTLAGFNSWLRPHARCVAGIPGEWLQRAAAQGGAEDNESFVLNTDPEVMKRVADDLVEEAGVRFLFHTWGAHPLLDGRRVVGLCIENVEGRFAVLSKVTIDCTGDGDVLARAGANWLKSDHLQPMTMPFRIGNVKTDPRIDHNQPMAFPIGPEATLLEGTMADRFASRRVDVPLDSAAMRAARGEGSIPVYGGPWFGGLEKDVVWVNATRVIGDASVGTELTRAEVAGRRDSESLMAYFREAIPGFADARLLQTSTQIGVRETRRLVGETTLTSDDIRSQRYNEVAIAIGCWPIDIHPDDGRVGVHQMDVPRPYGIPYECLVPADLAGLLVAGRCVSVDHEALASTRVGATCSAMGQAAGAAAAIAASGAVDPADVDVKRLRQCLVDHGAIVSVPS